MRQHRGPTILTLGILSLVICGFFGPVAWIMGGRDLAEMEGGTLEPEGRGLTQAGRLLGIVGTGKGVIEIAWACFILSRMFAIGNGAFP